MFFGGFFFFFFFWLLDCYLPISVRKAGSRGMLLLHPSLSGQVVCVFGPASLAKSNSQRTRFGY